MHNDTGLPNLTFPDITFAATETPWNLNSLLYRHGAAAPANLVQQQICGGKLGEPLIDRLGLVLAFHTEITAFLAKGGTRETAQNSIAHLRYLFRFADEAFLPLTLEKVTDTYVAWSDELYHRTLVKRGQISSLGKRKVLPIKQKSAFQYLASVGTLIDRLLERHTSVVQLTRVVADKRRKTPVGPQADKQNLEHTFAFGHLLQDICDGLSLEVIRNAVPPLRIPLRSGKELIRTDRPSLPNVRVEAELLMFIGQTGINPSQAVNLELQNFFYLSHLDGYQVKEYKARRQGIVLFEIFKEYKPHFERYLAWRRTLFPTAIKLFPFIEKEGSREGKRFQGFRLRAICKQLAMSYIPPQTLRNTRVNWLLRQSANPDLTAEMSQHTKEVLLAVYERPSLHRAMVEATRFWRKVDPLLNKTTAVAPGECSGIPVTLANIPREAPVPDCGRPAGCLWCENHRDVDTEDYIWALVTFKHLKAIELSRGRLAVNDAGIPPARRVIDRINEKLTWFNESNTLRKDWVEEAEIRIEEESYHPDFEGEIIDLEGK